MNKALSIVIPAYNQTDLLRRSLNALRNQSRKDFSIIIIDDQSTQDYKQVVAEFPDLDVTYTRNEKNLGAIRNIFNSILYNVDTPFILSLHEDDLLHYQYIEVALAALEKSSSLAFAGSTAVWYTDIENLESKRRSEKELSETHLYNNAKQLTQAIIDDVHLTFGSIIYRTSALQGAGPDLEHFSVMCDRPFLLSIMKGSHTAAILIEQGIYVRDHTVIEDHRGDTLREKYLIATYEYYRSKLEPMSASEKRTFLKHTTNHLLYGYYSLGTREVSFITFIRALYAHKLFELKYLRPLGIFGIVSYICGSRVSRGFYKIYRMLS